MAGKNSTVIVIAVNVGLFNLSFQEGRGPLLCGCVCVCFHHSLAKREIDSQQRALTISLLLNFYSRENFKFINYTFLIFVKVYRKSGDMLVIIWILKYNLGKLSIRDLKNDLVVGLGPKR